MAMKRMFDSSSSEESLSSWEEEASNVKMNNDNNKKPKSQENGKTLTIPPADVRDYPTRFVYEIDMPGLKYGGEVNVYVEDGDSLVISGERKRQEGAQYLRTERKVGKFMRKFVLPKNANTDVVSAICRDGVLSVTVQKFPNKLRKTIQVIMA